MYLREIMEILTYIDMNSLNNLESRQVFFFQNIVFIENIFVEYFFYIKKRNKKFRQKPVIVTKIL